MRIKLGVNKMGLLDLANKTKAPTIYKTVRQLCHDYEGAYAYFQDRVGEMDKKQNFSWVKQDAAGDWVVRITLHSMPLYWVVEDAKPASTIEIKDPSGNVLETRPKQIGHTAYIVDSYESGIELLKALASTKDEDFKAVLTNAAEALKEVDEVELPNINTKAEAEFDKSEWSREFGVWQTKDAEGKTGQVYSKKKTNKMNQYKQLARRQLGYERAKVVVTLR
jgi:hypothetical protein|tara:strand:+ start:1335 stop:2000 length:666 start_codon:yes stop_codon:yes gene_type:complete